ncbi:MAG: ferritin family protein [Gammaproteobacteria bacterium]|nr:ferritin family protein [Gammaproteobacteria bacterium]
MKSSTDLLATFVQTTSDLMSIALQAEREAIRRYSQLAVTMHEGNNKSAAALFERMVKEEHEHERLLLEWMAQEGINENPKIEPVKWRDPKISTTYDDEARDPLYSTPYRALAFAVHNEEIAFRFYTHVAADSKNEAVRKYAEILAREELGHAALLRAERRHAYHAERKINITEPRLNPRNVHTEADLLTTAIHIDLYLNNAMAIISGESPEIQALINETQQVIDRNKLSLEEKELPGDDILKDLEQVDSYNTQIDNISDSSEAKLNRLRACCDRSFAFYDSIVDSTDDEKIMLTAQKLSSSALDRIGILKKVLGNRPMPDDPDIQQT